MTDRRPPLSNVTRAPEAGGVGPRPQRSEPRQSPRSDNPNVGERTKDAERIVHDHRRSTNTRGDGNDRERF